ncbi:unnamed protein product [Pylaiella littoralis]
MKVSNRWLGLLGAVAATSLMGVTATSSSITTCDDDSIGNGFCDMGNNNRVCGYDGGDCCKCTCVDIPGTGTSPDTICGQYSGFACIDPEAYCVDDDDVIVADINVVFPDLVGDGFCDESNNKPEQNYDGGDCCECTCKTDFEFYCRAFDCIDPEAWCADDDIITASMSYEFIYWEQDSSYRFSYPM